MYEKQQDGYLEIVEDEELAALLESGALVTFRVVDESWEADDTVRRIKRAEIVSSVGASRGA